MWNALSIAHRVESTASGPLYAMHMLFVVEPKASNMHWCCVDIVYLSHQTPAVRRTHIFTILSCKYQFRYFSVCNRNSNHPTDGICFLSITVRSFVLSTSFVVFFFCFSFPTFSTLLSRAVTNCWINPEGSAHSVVRLYVF